MTQKATRPRTPLVLIIDDDAGTRLLVRECLEQNDFIVEEAEDGLQGLSKFASLNPDIVLLDVVMPRMDGFAACAEIRRFDSGDHTPIIMMTGLDDTKSINLAYEAGATDFINKPINWTVLPHRLRYILRSSGALVKLDKAFEELKELERLKDAFLSSVSHELRTPLTSIRSFSEILLSYDDVAPQNYREFLRIINTESERLTRLIDDVLDLSKIEAGMMAWNDELLRLEEVLNSVIKAQKPLYQTKSLQLLLDIPPDIPPVYADRDRIHQVMTNLINNAIKFSFEGGEIRIRAEVFIGKRFSETLTWVRVSVADQGAGIAAKDLAAIFDKFRQGTSNTLTDKPKGTGLGLPICREIITHYEGNIWVESRKGEESTFFFTLPAAPGLAESTRKPSSASSPAGHLKRKKRPVAVKKSWDAGASQATTTETGTRNSGNSPPDTSRTEGDG